MLPQKADVWSCGVLLYKLLTGSFPFSRAEDAKLPRKERFQALVQVRCLGMYGLACQGMLHVPACSCL